MFKPLEYGYALPLVDHGAAADAASAVRMQAKLQSRDRGPPRGPADMIRHTLKDIGGQKLLTKQTLPQQLIAKKKLRLAARGSVDDADDVDKLTGLSSAVSAGKRLPYLYWVTVLRDPVDRIFSEFFFLRPACGLRNTRTLVGKYFFIIKKYKHSKHIQTHPNTHTTICSRRLLLGCSQTTHTLGCPPPPPCAFARVGITARPLLMLTCFQIYALNDDDAVFIVSTTHVTSDPTLPPLPTYVDRSRELARLVPTISQECGLRQRSVHVWDAARVSSC